MSASYEFRKGDRPAEVCNHNIQDFTEREHYFGIALRIYFNESGEPCKVHDHGVDGTGTIIFDKLSCYDADKLFEFTNGVKQAIEIKTAIEACDGNFFTFKVFCLEQCIREDAWVCVPRRRWFYLFTPDALKKMLDKKLFEQRIYHDFSDNDKAVRISMEYIHYNMISDGIAFRRNWGPESQKYVYDNVDILFREKKTK